MTFGSDGDLIVSDRVAADGAHAIWVSTDGTTWVSVPSDGDVPRTSAPPTLVALPEGIVLVTADGIWQGAWVDRGLGHVTAPDLCAAGCRAHRG